jgi:hypothetical protein
MFYLQHGADWLGVKKKKKRRGKEVGVAVMVLFVPLHACAATLWGEEPHGQISRMLWCAWWWVVQR